MRQLNEIAMIYSGNSIPQKKKEELFCGLDAGTPYVATKDVGTDHSINYENGVLIPETHRDSFKLAPANSVLICAEGGSAGKKVAHTDKDIHFVNKLFCVHPNEEMSSKYIFYYFLSADFKLDFNNQLTGLIGGVSLKKFKNLCIPYISLDKQERIAALLDTVFADLEQTRAKTEQNLKNARELFDSYLQQVFSQKGESWIDGKMTDICEINTKLIDPKEDVYLDLLHIGAGNIVSNTGELIKLKTAKEEGLISGKFVFDNSMVLYSKIRPYLMKVCRPEFTGLCSADIYPLSPIKEMMDKDFLFYLLLSKDFTDYAISGSGRAGMPKVNRTHLFNYSVSIPPIEKQREFVIKINQVASRSQDLEKIYKSKLIAIDELKKSILQKAFSDELTAMAE